MNQCNFKIPDMETFKCSDQIISNLMDKIVLKSVNDFNRQLEQKLIEKFKAIHIYFADMKDFYSFIGDNCTLEINTDTGEHLFYLHNHDFKGHKILVATWNNNFKIEQDDNSITITYNI